ncbi:AAA family ATPase [Paenibacillus gansuensis]|uniref:AAA family ATPase n=1 Tax=Paenibacillus gansuensis TaxID=306542 RepID=A0ABW5PBD3_9BACL
MVTIVWVDPDQEYLQLVSRFLRVSGRLSEMNVIYISNQEEWERFAASAQHCDILLIHENWLEKGRTYASRCTIAVTEKNSNGETAERSVAKYQSMDALLSVVYSLYADAAGVQWNRTGNRAAKVISVFSSCGGSGKTTVAVNLAKLLSSGGSSVLYLNLESVTSSDIWLEPEGGENFSTIIYYLQHEPEQLPAKLRASIRKDPYTGVYCINPHHSVREMQQLSGGQMKQFIDRILELEEYDYIVIDLESVYHERVLASMQASQWTIWLLLDDLQSISRTARWLDELAFRQPQEHAFIRPSLRFFTNKYTGSMHPSDHSLQISGVLPYIPQWKNVRSKEQLLMNRMFDDNLMQIIHLLGGAAG